MSEPRPGRISAAAHATTPAPIDDVWALLADARGWSRWARMSSSALEREGDGEPDGVGAIRRFVTGPITSREQVVVFERPRRLAYVLLSGMPLRNYRSEITLAPTPGGGTRIEWTSTFDPQIPGTGWLMRAFMLVVLRDYLRRLADAAERRGRAA